MFQYSYDKICSCNDYKELIIPFISTTEAIADVSQSDTHIGNDWSSYLTELEKLGASVAYTDSYGVTLTPMVNIQEQPYPSWLHRGFVDLLAGMRRDASHCYI